MDYSQLYRHGQKPNLNECIDIISSLSSSKQNPKTEHTTLLNIEVPVRKEVSVNDCLDEHCKGEVIRAENAMYVTITSLFKILANVLAICMTPVCKYNSCI